LNPLAYIADRRKDLPQEQRQMVCYISRTMSLPKTGPMKWRIRARKGEGNCLARSLE
jgi:hypothetical protein